MTPGLDTSNVFRMTVDGASTAPLEKVRAALKKLARRLKRKSAFERQRDRVLKIVAREPRVRASATPLAGGGFRGDPALPRVSRKVQHAYAKLKRIAHRDGVPMTREILGGAQ